MRISVLGMKPHPHLTEELQALAEELRNEAPAFCDVEITLRPESGKSHKYSLAAKVDGFRKSIIAKAEGWELKTLLHQVSTRVIHQLHRMQDQIVTKRRRRMHFSRIRIESPQII
jgi:hypothetical protein